MKVRRAEIDRFVFSTHVEMFLQLRLTVFCLTCFLHACGDVSGTGPREWRHNGFSPRMWRCFLLHIREADLGIVFSTALCVLSATLVFFTHVEMFLFQCFVRFRLIRFLHACGDVSGCSILISPQARFSPRMWRCFSVGSKGVSHR